MNIINVHSYSNAGFIHSPLGQTSIQQHRTDFEPTALHRLVRGCRSVNGSWCDHPANYPTRAYWISYESGNNYHNGGEISWWNTWAIRIADRSPDWIWPKWTTPVTPTTSSIPSQWFGLENWSSFSGPHGLAPEPQLQHIRISNSLISFILTQNATAKATTRLFRC